MVSRCDGPWRPHWRVWAAASSRVRASREPRLHAPRARPRGTRTRLRCPLPDTSRTPRPPRAGASPSPADRVRTPGVNRAGARTERRARARCAASSPSTSGSSNASTVRTRRHLPRIGSDETFFPNAQPIVFSADASDLTSASLDLPGPSSRRERQPTRFWPSWRASGCFMVVNAHRLFDTACALG